jgi:Na+/H+ antiporter NhaC
MSSMASGADHLDHVKTQIPYAITGAIFAMISYIIVGVFNNIIGTILALAFGVVGIIVLVKMIGKKTDEETLNSNS